MLIFTQTLRPKIGPLLVQQPPWPAADKFWSFLIIRGFLQIHLKRKSLPTPEGLRRHRSKTELCYWVPTWVCMCVCPSLLLSSNMSVHVCVSIQVTPSLLPTATSHRFPQPNLHFHTPDKLLELLPPSILDRPITFLFPGVRLSTEKMVTEKAMPFSLQRSVGQSEMMGSHGFSKLKYFAKG